MILGRLENKITAKKKIKAWEEVTTCVSAGSRVGRSSEEHRRKFKDLRSHIKIKAAAEQCHSADTGEFNGFAVYIFVSIVADLS